MYEIFVLAKIVNIPRKIEKKKWTVRFQEDI